MRYRSILAFTLLAFLSPCSSADARLYLTPLATSVFVGGSLTIGLGASGLDLAPAIAGFDVTITFDSDRIQFQGIQLGDPRLGDQLHFDQSTPPPQFLVHHEPGELQLIASSLDPTTSLEESQADSFLLAVLGFEAHLAGRTQLSLELNGLSGTAGAPLTAQAVGTSVLIVPSPPARILMTAGLATLLVSAAFSRSANQALN